MDKKEFLRILAAGGGEADAGGRTSWVNILSDLQKRKTPFTKMDVVKQYKVKPNYAYSHLRDWVIEGTLLKINHGGANVYLAANQVEKAAPAA